MSQNANRARVFGDDLDTDQLAPGIYIKLPIEELARHCLEGVSPGFATSVQQGDVIVAGQNFGMGSSREQAAETLHHLGIRAIVAQSFGGIFYRNALNFGIMPLVCAEASSICEGDTIAIDAEAGKIINLSQNETYDCDPMPEVLRNIVQEGGLLAHLENRLSAAQK